MSKPGWQAWTDAAVGLFLHSKLVPGSTSVLPDAEATLQHLMILARAQGGTELALDRHRECRLLNEQRKSADLALLVRHSLDAHSLLVSANLFWNTLDGLAKQVSSFPELSRVQHEFAEDRTESQQARDHIEHLTERTCEGRASRRSGGEMTCEVFRRAVGKIEGDEIVFGSERFDLVRIAGRVKEAGDRLALAFATKGFPLPGVSVTITPSVQMHE